jgi:glycerol-3-phosphate dehydrogenase (NAD(P)+)
MALLRSEVMVSEGPQEKQATILGAGSFGTALAVHLARAGHSVRLWARDPALADAISERRSNPTYLPELILPENVCATSDLDRALGGAHLVISALPSHGTRDVMTRAVPFMEPGVPIVSATKGLEEGSLLRMTELIGQIVGPSRPVAVVSGPSFAAEVGRGMPTAVVVAAENEGMVALVQEELRTKYLRLYGTSDVVGVEIGGALKNVIAIAAGVVEGMGIGQNALAGLITRGLAEISRLACALGARRDTLAGLAGLGDLVLTCTGSLSRNRHVGIELARGRSLDDIVGSMKMVAEGIKTTDAALALGRRTGVELPIATQMAEVFAGKKDARAALQDLMLRRQRRESDSG